MITSKHGWEKQPYKQCMNSVLAFRKVNSPLLSKWCRLNGIQCHFTTFAF